MRAHLGRSPIGIARLADKLGLRVARGTSRLQVHLKADTTTESYVVSGFRWTRTMLHTRPLILAAVLVIAVTAAAQQPSALPALMQDPSVRAALVAAKSSEPQTINDQIRFCEVPAPPFKEAA